ncbi:MAG: hypothetical protein AB8C13_05065 [Phycisphaerales bacterium]
MCVAALAGCGFGESNIKLPNGYWLSNDRWIFNEQDKEFLELQVIDINWDQSHIYGRSERRQPYISEYNWFIIDTRDGRLSGFMNPEEWLKHLEFENVSHTELKLPSEIAKKRTLQVIAVLTVIYSSVVACGYLIYRKLKARRVIPDRL